MTSAATNPNWTGTAGNDTFGLVGRWIARGLVHTLHHPLESAMALTLTVGIGFGAINAMFLQTERHPAPLFMDTASIAQPVDSMIAGTATAVRQPIPIPLMRPFQLTVTPQTATTVAIPDTVGNRDVAELQARLAELGFFTGTIDGYYGPKTADAIRNFEIKAGLEPVGAMSKDVLTAARTYSFSATPQPAIQPVHSPDDDLIGRLAASAENEATAEAVAATEVANVRSAATDPQLVRMVQTGLSRLGFLHAEISGKFDAETARAIREFENYNNFRVTGEMTPDLVDVLMAAGAYD